MKIQENIIFNDKMENGRPRYLRRLVFDGSKIGHEAIEAGPKRKTRRSSQRKKAPGRTTITQEKPDAASFRSLFFIRSKRGTGREASRIGNHIYSFLRKLVFGESFHSFTHEKVARSEPYERDPHVYSCLKGTLRNSR